MRVLRSRFVEDERLLSLSSSSPLDRVREAWIWFEENVSHAVLAGRGAPLRARDAGTHAPMQRDVGRSAAGGGSPDTMTTTLGEPYAMSPR